jgi:ribonuclease R
VQEIIDNKKGIHEEEILTLHHIAQRMRKQRIKKGAINFSSQEVRFRLDEKGKPCVAAGLVSSDSQLAEQALSLRAKFKAWGAQLYPPEEFVKRNASPSSY